MTIRAALIDTGKVVNVTNFKAGLKVLPDGWVECPNEVAIGWDCDGAEFTAPVVSIPEPTPEEKIAAYRFAVGAHIDNEAQKLGFDSIVTAVTYADEPADPLNQSYGQALRAWRSQCWGKCREVLATWQGGGAEPTVEELIASLPAFVAP